MKLYTTGIAFVMISVMPCNLINISNNISSDIQKNNTTLVSNQKKIDVTEKEYELLLRVCMSECGGKYGEPLEGKVAVAETVINRSEIYGKTIEEVITAPYQYSLAYNGEPDETVIEAVDIALSSNSYPDDMIYFRTKHYHNFGVPYKQIGNHYFSLKESD